MTRSRQRLPAAAVFDWDGTIVDTLPLIYRANVVVLGELGIPLSRAWFRERYTPDWRARTASSACPRIAGTPSRRAGPRRCGPAGRERSRGSAAASGGWPATACALGLVTASTRSVVEPNLRAAQPRRACSRPRTSPTTWSTASRIPEGLLRALADLDVDPADAVYVGDTTVDLAMASAAGTAFAAVAGTTSGASFREAGVERVWSDVGAWADDLLGRPPRQAPRRA